MLTFNIFISFFFFLFSLIIKIKNDNSCSNNSTPPKEIESIENFKTSNLFENGNNYGKPFYIGSYVFLTGLHIFNRNNYDKQCPNGYKLPTKDIYENITKTLGEELKNQLLLVDGFNLTDGYYYMTSDTDTDENNFYALMYNDSKIELKTVDIGTCNSCYTICVLEKGRNEIIQINGIEKDLVVGQSRNLSIDNSKGYLIKINDQIYENKEIKIYSNILGCTNIEIWGIAIDNNTYYICKQICTRELTYTNECPNFDISMVSELDYEYNVTRIKDIFLSESQAPIAPKSDGGYYLAFKDKDTNNLHIVEFDKNDSLINDIELEYKASPFDIRQIKNGFANRCLKDIG